ncbi:hypothetical protein SAMN04488570_1363 [Nocardioides scoriae]|uniref:Uncharacterized protein n=1 Tax=Nocardioides scoriae TaxID=642780 RepID=A0A1H1QAR3_9ACTN|nr:hypothetical protein [Nocardioides scoriae]SDS20546.1 hypothetical protein SAMN04488570_1363 [Nocardioides scoriae]
MTLISSPEAPAIVCPPWCMRYDHDADVVDENNPPNHYGPDFGVLGTQAVGEGAPRGLISTPLSDMSPHDLRRLAAAAVAAAEWMEAHS